MFGQKEKEMRIINERDLWSLNLRPNFFNCHILRILYGLNSNVHFAITHGNQV